MVVSVILTIRDFVVIDGADDSELKQIWLARRE